MDQLLDMFVDLGGLTDPVRQLNRGAEGLAALLDVPVAVLAKPDEAGEYLICKGSSNPVDCPAPVCIGEIARFNAVFSALLNTDAATMHRRSGAPDFDAVTGALFPGYGGDRLYIFSVRDGGARPPGLLAFGLASAPHRLSAGQADRAIKVLRFLGRIARMATRLHAQAYRNAYLQAMLLDTQRRASGGKEPPVPSAERMLVGSSREIRAVRDQVYHMAPTDIPVLITGETGTGKEVAARKLHSFSARSKAPFVAINVAALPETLVESELFGHEKGAFTGADARRVGFIEQADGGTLFLDEIGDMAPGLQARLLRVLQERTFFPLGSAVERRSDFRLICATHQDLEEKIRLNTFREDLFFRINQCRLRLPPLRERDGDVLELADHFIRSLAAADACREKPLTAAAEAFLLTHPFPGNVRELQSMIQTAWLRADDHIDVRHLADGRMIDAAPASARDKPLKQVLEGQEKRAIQAALLRFGGDRRKAARALGVPERTLYRKIDKYGLAAP